MSRKHKFYNAVKAGLVFNPEDYVYSSATPCWRRYDRECWFRFVICTKTKGANKVKQS